MGTAEVQPRAGSIGHALALVVKLEHRIALLNARIEESLDARGPAMLYVRTELRAIGAVLVAMADELRDIPDEMIGVRHG